MSSTAFPSVKIKLFMLFWRVLWFLATPLVVLYLWRRGRADALYKAHIAERFGQHPARDAPHVWVHAVSLGELRSAVPLIQSLLDDGEHVVTTHFTPAGRRAAQAAFGPYIASGQLSAVWVPFDYPAAFKRFFKAFQPKFGLVMEVEFWPGMIMSARRAQVPLFLCNGQYPARSYARDRQKWLSRAHIVAGFAGVMVKSQRQAERFASLGVQNIEITGELRFEQPVPIAQIDAGQAARGPRHTIGFTSVVKGEDELLIAAMKAVAAKTNPLFVYVPRAPERFNDVAQLLESKGFSVTRRSDVFDASLGKLSDWTQSDVLLGDSLGEMYFYLSLCDRVLVGGGFTEKGSHNISEPLAVGKPVLVGPDTRTIEFPAEEAIAAGVCIKTNSDQLVGHLTAPDWTDETTIAQFMSDNGGAVRRTRDAIVRLLAVTSR